MPKQEKVVVKFQGELEFTAKHGIEKAQRDLDEKIISWIHKHAEGGVLGHSKCYVHPKQS